VINTGDGYVYPAKLQKTSHVGSILTSGQYNRGAGNKTKIMESVLTMGMESVV
jgi:hypothetical protein